jgi:hypothetical protein
VQNGQDFAPEPQASHVCVWQSADRILQSGRRPTVDCVRAVLGGGSPNSVTAYINDWYRELRSRLAAAETPLSGFPPEAVSLMTELWRLAASDHAGTSESEAAGDTSTRVLAAERNALHAQAKARQTLNGELQSHRATAEKSLAEAPALLTRREAALEEERSRAASLHQALAQARMEFEVLLERRRLSSTRAESAGSRRKQKERKRTTAHGPKVKHTKNAKDRKPQQSESRKPTKRAARRRRHRNRRR